MSGRVLCEMLKFRFARLLMWMGLGAVATYFLDPSVANSAADLA